MEDLAGEAEGVRERVRGPADSSRRRTSHRSRRRSSPRGCGGDQNVEDELRRDEAGEAADATRASADERASGRTEPASSEAAEESSPRPAELFPDILGWQPLVLNRDLECGRCKRSLVAGESAFLGLGSSGVSEIALCGRCASSRGGRR
jgi:hypothetical protein